MVGGEVGGDCFFFFLEKKDEVVRVDFVEGEDENMRGVG